MKLKRFDLYSILTLALILLALVFLPTSWVAAPVLLVLVAQYEFVYINVTVILRHDVLLRSKVISEPMLTKLQTAIKNLFKL